MKTSDEYLARLPNASGAVVVLSGGMDSTTSLRFAVEKYGAANVRAITFFYGQKQYAEINAARRSCARLGVAWEQMALGFLQDINQGFSANVDHDISMPTIQDVLGDPAPVTYVANRNMILLSIAAAYAERHGLEVVVCGFQSNDTYGYHDTTPTFLAKINDVLSENRKIGIRVVAPFVDLNKKDEIEAVLSLDSNLDLFKDTLTCYNPFPILGDVHTEVGGVPAYIPNGLVKVLSCGVCPSCSERLAAFKKLGLEDPVPYIHLS